MDSDDGAPDDGVLDGLNLGADVDQYNVPAPVVLPASGSTTAAPVQAVVRVDGAGGSGGPSAPPPRRAPATHVDAVDADDVRDTTSQSASASPSAVAMPVLHLETVARRQRCIESQSLPGSQCICIDMRTYLRQLRRSRATRRSGVSFDQFRPTSLI